MISQFLCTDVLAIRCVDQLVFVGIGCTLHIFNADTCKIEGKIDCLYPDNIHGIVDGSNNKLAVFGANSFCTYVIRKKEGTLAIEEDVKRKCLGDWIVAANWSTLQGRDLLAVLSAHNNVYMYDLLDDGYRDIWCEEKCILYAGSILVKKNEDLVILSGTVFQEILIWEVTRTSRSETAPILHRLKGHNGVIFSVVYDPLTHLICSTSDDRTVRLWAVNHGENEGTDNASWKRAKIKLIRTLFGHAARVWRSVIRNGTLITIGEDSLMCTWSLDGKLLNKICAHHGAAIWSIDVSEDNKNAFTGGADGAVYAWSLANDCIQRNVLLPKTQEFTLPKYVCCLSNGDFLIFNEDGHVFVCNRSHDVPIELVYLERYSTYCVMEVSFCRSYVCFASRDGYLTIYKATDGSNDRRLQQVVEEKIMESRIFSIQWLQDNKLIACGSTGALKIITFSMDGSVTVRSTCLLPPSRERWLTAAVLYEGLLVCGDRAGNMHVFELRESVLRDPANVTEMDHRPIQTFAKIHGKIGIQHFLVLGSKLMSAGRDGMLRFYEISKQETTKLHALHKEKMPMDWISGSLKTSDDTFVLGFKEVQFIIYSLLHHRTVTRIPCGGGHRSWDCMIIDESITFLYIRNKQVHASDFSLSSIKSPVLLNGFHTKEIYCMNPISKIGDDDICVSGGEDGTLRIACVSSDSLKNHCSFRTLGIFDGHISSIKSIASLNLRSNFSRKHLVFSGGGRAQIKVWEIDIKNRERVLQDADISCCDVTSHMLYGFDRNRKKQSHNQSYVMQPETRYMDIEIYRDTKSLHYVLLFVACADGFVRIFLYDVDTKHISLKVHAKCGDRCVAKISILAHEDRVIALTMSTDGIGRFVDFTETVSKILSEVESEAQEYRDFADAFLDKFSLHQSGINSYDVRTIRKDEYLLATGGDDNLFSIIRFKIYCGGDEKEARVSLLSKWSTSTAHYAQITGIRFHGEKHIFSIGMDQQVIMYSYDYSDDNLSVEVLKQVFTFVTDAKGLTLWCDPKGEPVVCIYGKGFEVMRC
ncbi:trafficking protein particle complex subunit 31 isoform X1 [Andrena cerasifolii]|uniref:trafficking protein particle complex subunit 31 isoform X1 n=1 Tax=Andrena cerasifolii TaxID=2819439 RepID=UPI0040379C1A